jgi:hypothetical protein
MGHYDSDSSDLEDAGDYTETNVLLGYATDEPSDDTTSHLGGLTVLIFSLALRPFFLFSFIHSFFSLL